jgi:hypothetical protein
MQGHILRMLESPGAEPVLLVLNILWELYRDLDRDQFLYEAEAAIRGLARLGYIAPCRDDDFTLLPAAEAAAWLAISTLVQWAPKSEGWYWTEGRADNPGIDYLLTAEGRRALVR